MKFFFLCYRKIFDFPKEEKKEENLKKDTTTVPDILPYTGITEKILVGVCLLGILVMIMHFQYKQYKDIQ